MSPTRHQILRSHLCSNPQFLATSVLERSAMPKRSLPNAVSGSASIEPPLQRPRFRLRMKSAPAGPAGASAAEAAQVAKADRLAIRRAARAAVPPTEQADRPVSRRLAHAAVQRAARAAMSPTETADRLAVRRAAYRLAVAVSPAVSPTEKAAHAAVRRAARAAASPTEKADRLAARRAAHHYYGFTMDLLRI